MGRYYKNLVLIAALICLGPMNYVTAEDVNEPAQLQSADPNITDSNSISQAPVADQNAPTAQLAQAQTAPQDMNTPSQGSAVVKVSPPSAAKIDSEFQNAMSKRVSVDFRDAPIEDVLRILSQQAGVNIIKSPKVTGMVTATLNDVPLNEALNNLLAVHGFTYIPSENMIRVIPIADVAVDQQKMVSKVYRIKYADVKDVAFAIKQFVGKTGEISFNQGTSNIIITDTEDKITAIDNFITEIDRVTPQVLVEARIYDISTNDSLDLGIKWQAGRRGVDGLVTVSGDNSSFASTQNRTFGFGGIGSLGNVISGSGNKTDPFVNGTFNAGTDKTGSGDGLLRFGFLNQHVNIDALLKAEQKDTCAKLLANPRVLVLDNELANIKIVSEVPYQELTQSSGGGNIGTTAFKEVGVELKVIPHITTDGLIRLKLKPSFSTQVDIFRLAIPGTDQVSEVPVIDKRETETIALVKDGETVVLGGLKRKTKDQELHKIPLLGDIPIAGYLFRFKGERVINSELVVFITPKVVIQPCLTPTEVRQLQSTEFSGPECRMEPILNELKKD